MATETERKFLTRGDFRPLAIRSERITQGYICAMPGKTVRVRLAGNQAWLTIKGPSGASGWSRYEFEAPVSLSDGEELLRLCEQGLIDKERFYVPAGRHTWEVDVFYGANEGLVVAEIELGSEEEAFDRPDWLGREVTGDKRYYNARLSAYPFSQWTVEEYNE
jgi:CYTH domain-containing protein